MLPVLHLNGYKINNPTLLARISHEELEALFVGYGYTPLFVEGSDPGSMHQAMAATLEHCVLQIRKIQEEARRTGKAVTAALAHDHSAQPQRLDRPAKGGRTLPRRLLAGAPDPDRGCATNPAHLKLLEKWLRSYKPEELFDKNGPAHPGVESAGAEGAPADERQPRRQRRVAYESRWTCPTSATPASSQETRHHAGQ